MNFNEYQIEARKTAVYPNIENNIWYLHWDYVEKLEKYRFFKRKTE